MLRKEYDQTKLEQRKVRTLTGISLRWFAKVQVEKFEKTQNGYKSKWVKDALADWVTGTVYSLEGDCYSSDQLKIIETNEKPYCSIKSMMEQFEFGRGFEYDIGTD